MVDSTHLLSADLSIGFTGEHDKSHYRWIEPRLSQKDPSHFQGARFGPQTDPTKQITRPNLFFCLFDAGQVKLCGDPAPAALTEYTQEGFYLLSVDFYYGWQLAGIRLRFLSC